MIRIKVAEPVVTEALAGKVTAVLLDTKSYLDVSRIDPGDSVILFNGSREAVVKVTAITRLLRGCMDDRLLGKAGILSLSGAEKDRDSPVNVLEFVLPRPTLAEALKEWSLSEEWEIVEETADDIQIGWVQLKDKAIRIGVYQDDEGVWRFTHLEFQPADGDKEVYVDNPTFIADLAHVLLDMPRHIRT